MLTACTKTEKTEGNQEQETKYDYLVLVNKQHKLPEDWEANVELVETKNAFDETIKVEKEAYEQYLELRNELLKD
jgi:D-alanyl-D-alanine carboxypeptidase